jgi:ligand-binding sensor domain-containing protein
MHVITAKPRALRRVLPLSAVAFSIRAIAIVAGCLACMTLADIKAFGMLPNGPEMKPLVAHTSWTGRDGAPGNIAALAQTGDGYLWLGTPLGLYRFDGLQFTKYPVTAMEIKLPSSDVEALCPDSQGGLWIGFRTGGISHLAADGNLANYNLQNGLGPNSVLSLVLRSDNSIWAIGDGELLKFRAGQWENFGAKHGLPSDKLFSLFFDRSGNLWTSARHELFVLREGNPEFKLYSKQTFVVADFAEMPNGQLWISDAWRCIRPLNANSPPLPIATKSYTRILIEPSGTLWMAADYRGVSHIQLHPEAHAPEKIVQESGVTSEQTDSLIRDRDGNIWVGTSRGLDRFREVSVKILSNLRVEYYPSLARDLAGNVWIAALAHPLIRAANSSLSKFGPNVGSSPIVCDQEGRVWLVDPMRNALMRLDHGTVFQVSVPPEVHHNDANSIGLDRNGAILVSFEGSGLWRYDGSWSRIKDMSFPAEDPLTILLDQANNLWLGFQAGGIVMQDERGYHSFADGLNGNLGNVLTFGISHNRLWAAGANGIAYFDKGSFHRVTFQGGPDLLGISGVVEDRSGNLWLNASTGIVCIPSSELSSMLLGMRPALDYDEFNERQGVIGTATQMKPTPSAVADKNGTLWFATSGNVFEVSPSSLSVGQKHPLLSIQDVLLNGKVAMDREHGSDRNQEQHRRSKRFGNRLCRNRSHFSRESDIQVHAGGRRQELETGWRPAPGVL